MKLAVRVQELLGSFRDSNLLSTRLGIQSVLSLGIQSSTRLITFLLAILLAHHLSPEQYGFYAYMLAIMNILLVVAEFGIPSLVLRESSANRGNANHSMSVVLGGVRRSLSATTLVAGCALFLTGFVDLFSLGAGKSFMLMLACLPVIAVTKIIGHALRGIQVPVLAQTLDTLAQPVLLIACVGVVVAYAPSIMGVDLVMMFWFGSGTLVLVSAIMVFQAVLRDRPVQSKSVEPKSIKITVANAWPFFLLCLVSVINRQADIILVGLFLDSSEVAIFRVCVQLATIVAFAATIVSSVFAPRYAELHRQGDFEKLQRVAKTCARLLFFSALPIALILAWWAEAVLSVLFGSHYSAGAEVFRWLLFGQMAAACVGSPGFLLSMSGNEKASLQVVWFSAIINIVLNIVLIPWLGILGAAIASFISAACLNIALRYKAMKILGVETFALWTAGKVGMK